MLRIVAKGPPQELRQDVTGIAPVPGLENRFDPALPNPFIQDIRRDSQDGGSLSGAISPANVQSRRDDRG